MPTRPDYGIDAPGVVRNLVLVSLAGLVAWGTAAAGWWSGRLTFAPSANVRIIFPIARMAIWPATGCGLMALWMLWDSRIGKIRARERLLDRIRWSGSEQVLDVGCGRGLLLIAAARRLTSGKAIGIDIWQSEDLSGNRPEATLQNAEAEGVADRVEVRTADMRKLPFPDASFDVVVSCAAIHNLYAADDRAKALDEIARVLRPGGHVLIDDIRHGAEYARRLTANGCSVRRVSALVTALFLGVLTFGSLRPVTLLASKPAA